MIPANVPPICQVPNCKEGAQLLSKQGDNVRYMITCRRHWTGLIKYQHDSNTSFVNT